MTKLSILEFTLMTGDTTARGALDNARDLTARAETWGYERIWVAEHHNMPGIASAATSVVLAHLAAGSKTIRVGAGGVMLPNHAPLIVAEHFGTLAHLFPGRIDLGLGRAPGTDQPTQHALRRTLNAADTFPQDVIELRNYFSTRAATQPVQAVPAAGTNVPLWILGSSTFGAQLAAALGLPFAFASQFAPGQLMEALALYYNRFEPSAQLAKPYVMIGVNIVAAETDAQARRLATTQQMSMVDLFRGGVRQMRPPIDDIETYWTPAEKAQTQRMLARSIHGSPATVRAGIDALIKETRADELMIVSNLYHHDDRLDSFELTAQAMQDEKEDFFFEKKKQKTFTNLEV